MGSSLALIGSAFLLTKHVTARLTVEMHLMKATLMLDVEVLKITNELYDYPISSTWIISVFEFFIRNWFAAEMIAVILKSLTNWLICDMYLHLNASIYSILIVNYLNVSGQNLLACDFNAGGVSDGFCGLEQEGGEWFRTATQSSPYGPITDHTSPGGV